MTKSRQRGLSWLGIIVCWLQQCRLSDVLGFLFYGRLVCYEGFASQLLTPSQLIYYTGKSNLCIQLTAPYYLPYLFLLRAETMISEEIESVQTEADDIEPGWSQSIWPLAMQLR